MDPYIQLAIGFGITGGSYFIATRFSPFACILVLFLGFIIFMKGADKIFFPEKQQHG